MALPGLVRANNLSDVTSKEKAWDNLGQNFVSSFSASLDPSASFDFANNRNLVDSVNGNALITFSRLTNGTYVASDGLIKTAASGVARYDYNPVSGKSLGLLVEQSTTNWVAGIGYNLFGMNAAILNTTETTAPDGTTTAKLFVANGTSSAPYIQPAINRASFSPYSSLTVSVYIKARTGFNGGSLNFASDPGSDNSPFVTVTFDPLNYANVDTVGAGGGVTGRSLYVGNGWFRCFASYNGVSISPGGSLQLDIKINSNGTSTTNGFYLWGEQIEGNPVPTSYIYTTTAPVTRSADILTFNSSSLPATIYSEFDTYAIDGVRGIASVNNNSSSELWQAFTSGGTVRVEAVSSGVTRGSVNSGTLSQSTTNKVAFSIGGSILAGSVNGAVASGLALAASPSTTQLQIGRTQSGMWLNTALSRLVLWSAPFSPIILQTLSTSGINGTLTSYQTITGKDVLNLNNVKAVSPRDFVFVRGLTSSAQSRLTTAFVNTTSGVTMASAKLLKLSPSSVGNYFASSGSLSAQNLKINGIQAASLSSTPFSGTTALFPLNITSVEMSSNFRLAPSFSAGVVSSPSIGVLMETSEFLLYGKVGQN